MTALVLGSFCPMHTGHVQLLKAAASIDSDLVVLVADHPSYGLPFQLRASWVRVALASSPVKLYILPDPDVFIGSKYDAQGVCLDEAPWQAWLRNTREVVSEHQITHLVAGEAYGVRAAKELGLTFVPVDLERRVQPVSATMLRNLWPHVQQYVPSWVKHNLTPVVAVIGPESTGKSTFVESYRHSSWAVVPEWAREYMAYNEQQVNFEYFVGVQSVLIDSAKQRGVGVLTDSTALSTLCYCGEYAQGLKQKFLAQSYFELERVNHYLLLYPDCPWVDDGTRVQGEEARLAWFDRAEGLLKKKGASYEVVKTPAYNPQKETIWEARKKLLDQRLAVFHYNWYKWLKELRPK